MEYSPFAINPLRLLHVYYDKNEGIDYKKNILSCEIVLKDQSYDKL